jgi:hypothetical protein
VAASWGVTGLDAATVGQLYQRVRTKLGVDQPPPELTTSYNPEYFAANAAVGVKVIEKPDLPDVRLGFYSLQGCDPRSWIFLDILGYWIIDPISKKRSV